MSQSYFYDHLSQDGEWFQSPSYGWCWTPYEVNDGWRPYCEGHWVYTDFGWSWASDETFGWATYHYGRWFFDDSYGWAWVPGYEWAPAWVAWRAGNDYVGWAPLPPRARWDVSAGLSYENTDAYAIPQNHWAFVPRQHLIDVNLTLQFTSVARNGTLLGRSRDETRFVVREGRPANMGPDVAEYETSLGRAVPRVRIVDADGPARGRGHESGKGTVGFFRPKFEPMPASQAAPPSASNRPAPIPDADMRRQSDERGRKLEGELSAERGRLARDQQAERRLQASPVAVEDTRKRQADEQQAFEAHATQQRQVLAQRMQKQVVRPARAAKPEKADAKGADKEKEKPKDKGRDREKSGR